VTSSGRASGRRRTTPEALACGFSLGNHCRRWPLREVGQRPGHDIRSFEPDGQDRLIEVKTTRYGEMTPFFITPNELEISETQTQRYHRHRLYAFAQKPRFIVLSGRVRGSCSLSAALYRAMPSGSVQTHPDDHPG